MKKHKGCMYISITFVIWLWLSAWDNNNILNAGKITTTAVGTILCTFYCYRVAFRWFLSTEYLIYVHVICTLWKKYLCVLCTVYSIYKTTITTVCICHIITVGEKHNNSIVCKMFLKKILYSLKYVWKRLKKELCKLRIKGFLYST